jgi:hypothetical protein
MRAARVDGGRLAATRDPDKRHQHDKDDGRAVEDVVAGN